MKALEKGVYLKSIENMPIRERIARAKYIEEEKIQDIEQIRTDLKEEINKLIEEGGILDA